VELARRAVCAELVGMGFVETVTHSLVGDAAAAAFLESECEVVRIEAAGPDRDGSLRPSILPSLLRARAHNRDNGVRPLRLFESAATWQMRGDVTEERQQVALLMDVDRPEDGLRPLRGVVDRLVALLAGRGAETRVEPDDSAGWLQPGAAVWLEGRPLGRIGVLAPEVRAMFGFDEPLLAGELALPSLYEFFPPDAAARPLPAFPAVERDVSAIVSESTPWTAIEDLVKKLAPEHLEAIEFDSAYRGAQVGAGRKSVLLRLRFRAADRTLTGEEVDAQVVAVIAGLEKGLNALIRR
jgi:phenylalanyl-tRNA synthetase beta chain